ncbi:HTH transcriptional regulator merR family [Mesoplasma florum L1]|uniref:HTH transcriptional regulator merR family n=2 Tax=Mesoplasma florum TaxID=2151 RepID=Q6F1U5_MESFL|nr:MerR family transcriptional regulator [Mesoplasma florum]AAT75528.1 HTH transcriptional regulator merR family [Mesoplasma florum L1]AGY41243.1 Transcriptional regulator, MerR family [Mesoplasma florum W37]ATI73127.1 MerR family transcriptional regulator [Mesoplasma florum]ATI73814.1 MerR family transcriptional regulator [Mesoplasma florum]AVN59472.1 MerR family transcriptional regulator [Mesoplasma florum]
MNNLTNSERLNENIKVITKQKLSIKEIATIFDVSEQTIRFYDSKGLLPFFEREDNNYRYTTVENLQWFKMVFLLRSAGMEIKNIKEYINLCMEGDSTVPQRLKIIQDQKKDLVSKIKGLQSELELLTSKEKHYKKILEENILDEWNPVNFEEIIQKKLK